MSDVIELGNDLGWVDQTIHLAGGWTWVRQSLASISEKEDG